MTLNWIYWLAGVFLAGFGAWLIFWSLLSDRAAGNRKLRRCSKCWYDMTSVVGLKCPECGRQSKAESGLHRSRRRWGWVSIGALALVAAFGLNWFVAGRVLGWGNVMPYWLQLRLIPVIGEDAVIQSFATLANSNMPINLDKTSTQLLQDLAMKQIQNPTPNYLHQTAARTLVGIKEKLTDRENVAHELLAASMKNPGYMYHIAGKLALEILGQDEFVTSVSNMVTQRMPSNPGRNDMAAWVLGDIKPPFSDATANATANILCSSGQEGLTIPTLQKLIEENPTPFFKTLWQRFESGDRTAKRNVLWALRANVRSNITGDPSYLNISRSACQMLADESANTRDDGTLLIGYFFPDVIMPVLPEISRLLSADLEWTRRHARSTLVNVKVAPSDEPKIVAVLCDQLRNGKDRGRALALEILFLRRQSLAPGVDDALLEALEKTQDSELADRIAQQLGINASARFLFPATFGPRSNSDWAKFEARLLPLLNQGGTQTFVACKWLGKMPNPSPDSIEKISTLRDDKSKPLPDRAAARDALLHIRDRLHPDTNPLAPLQ